MMKKQNKILIIVIMLLLSVVSIMAVSYSIWHVRSDQTDFNIAGSKCFKLTLTDKSDSINLKEQTPTTDEEGLKSVGYSFTIKNTCNTYATYQVNLEDLISETKRLSNMYIKVSLNNSNPLLLTDYDKVTPTLSEADYSFKLTSGSLAPKGSVGDSVDYTLKLWMDYETPALDEVMNATFASKITVVASYIEEENLNNNITISYVSNNSSYSNQGEEIEITGISTNYDIIEYSFDNVVYNKVKTKGKKVVIDNIFTEEKEAAVYLKDEVGNIKEEKIILSKLDQTGPEIKGVASETWGSVIPISINIKDNKSGLKEYQISEKEEIPSTWKSISGNEVDVTETVTSNGIYYIYAKDVLGNISHTSVTVTKIDDIVPIVDFNVTTGNGTAKIDASNSADNETGIAKYEYSVDNGTYYSSSTSIYNFAGLSHGNHTFNVRITDNAGNVSTASKTASVTVTYTVTYDANGGSGAPASQTKTHGVNLTLSSTKPTRTGYTFLGWSTSSSATSTSYSAGGTYSANANATLYAVWELSTFSITNTSVRGGSISVASTGISGSSVSFFVSPSSGFTYMGAKVLNASGSVIQTLSSDSRSFTMPQQAVTIRPSWRKNDLYVIKVDSKAASSWTIGKHEGETPALISYISSRNYIAFGSPFNENDTRYDVVSNSKFDVTDYESIVGTGSEYNNSECTPNMTVSVGIISNHSTWVNGGYGVASKYISSPQSFSIKGNISSYSGNYYVGVQFLSHKCGSAEFTNVYLVGKTYS